MDWTYTIWIIALPLITFLINGIFGTKYSEKLAGLLSTFSIGISLILSYYTAYMYFFAHEAHDGYQAVYGFKQVWMHFTDTLTFDMGILLDPISIMMLVVVTTISFLVHLYSIGYMEGDKGYYRFFAFLSLFSFSMLGLVVATNLFQIYFFWELVGVSSYLLIGFYYTKPSAVSAAKKAFIVTRFADLGFLIGIMVVSYYVGTFDFAELNSPTGAAASFTGGGTFMGLSVMGWALTLIFMGGAGKSAMFPLHIWLPDAMEGPTPVSALIHAATMVVAGVYLVARLFPLYHMIDGGAVLNIVAFVGATSALIAAIIAVTQYDIKRVLAFSTMSQIGYMMLALGVSGYEGHEGLGYMASMFHLFTHAMFKGLLFLAAGAIIHAVHSNDMRDMGGLRKYLPITHITFLIATLAIAGIPPFSGFFSKDEILAAAFEHHKIVFGIGYFVAGLTAFYMFRLYFNIFWGKDTKYEHTPHESPWTMTVPLIILAAATIFIGWAIPFHSLVTADLHHIETHIDWTIAGASIGIGILGIIIAWVLYKKESETPAKLAKSFGAFYKWTYNKFYIDEVYMFITHKIIFNRIAKPIAWFDKKVVDGTMDLIGNTTVSTSKGIKKVQSGHVQQYSFTIVAAVLIIILSVIYLWTN